MVLIPLESRSQRLLAAKNGNLPDSVPPHLTERIWLEYEQETARGVVRELKKVLFKLAKSDLSNGPAAKQVHDTRVALRRWEAVWSVLDKDGWNEPRYWEKAGKKLRKLHRLLGKLRDWDVNIEIAQSYKFPAEIIEEFLRRREEASKQVQARLKKLKVKKLLRRLEKFIEERPEQLAKSLSDPRILGQSAYEHLEPMIAEQEDTACILEAHAETPAELHELRLAIKSWRYFLTDYFGVTNLQLVRAQQILGKLNDIERVLGLLEANTSRGKTAKINVLKKQKMRLMEEFAGFRKNLPYGLRPSIVSIETQ
ncbi:MAG TPA: CHAD domain-containing protein [Candidatus Obscuribacterales bacterium]